MCSFLFSVAIVGAMEVTPGWMQVDYMWLPLADQAQVEQMYMQTDQYLDCYDND